MEINRLRALRGPNLWSRLTSFEALVQCADNELLLGELPGLVEHQLFNFPGGQAHGDSLKKKTPVRITDDPDRRTIKVYSLRR